MEILSIHDDTSDPDWIMRTITYTSTEVEPKTKEMVLAKKLNRNDSKKPSWAFQPTLEVHDYFDYLLFKAMYIEDLAGEERKIAFGYKVHPFYGQYFHQLDHAMQKYRMKNLLHEKMVSYEQKLAPFRKAKMR